MKFKRWACLLVLCALAAGWAGAEKVMVPMQDGVKLATDVYVPKEGGPAFPVVLTRSVYGRAVGAQLAVGYNKRGLVFVVQDTRGRGESEGEKDMVFLDDGWNEHKDGEDTVNWIRQQPWCNGTVGTWGMSALGITQVLMAGTGVDIDGQFIAVAAANFYDQLSYQGGVFRKQLVEKWVSGQKSPHVIELWKQHPTYDAFWEGFNATARAPKVVAPAVHIGGWFDIFGKGTVENFTSRQNNGGEGAKGNQKLIIGAWPHGPVKKVGDIELADNFNFDLGAYEKKFFGHWLLGEDNGIEKEPAVNYYTLGACGEEGAPGNEWRSADAWPPLPATETAYLLTADGGLTTDAAAVQAGKREYTFDPADPCPTVGGQNLSPDHGIGPMDQRKVSSRPDVLAFATPPLEAPVEITGGVKVRLFVSTDAPDTDFTAKLVDIYPDGREILMLDNIRRLKFRNGFEKAEPLPAGEVGMLEIDLWNISLIVNKGHRIGVQISSSNYPRFEVNPNTGADFPGYLSKKEDSMSVTDNWTVRKAVNTVYMDAEHPSALLLPIVKQQ